MTPDLHPLEPLDDDSSDPRRLAWVPLGSLLERPALRNPKAHDVETLAASMRRFGFVAPVTIDERTGRLVAGHGRLEALAAIRERGHEPPDGVQLVLSGLDGSLIDWSVPTYRGWRSADDAEAEAYLVADNELTMAAGWVRDPLADVLATIQQSPAGLTGTGYDDSRVAQLMAELGRTAPSFAPADPASQPRLDQHAPDLVRCPSCACQFDARTAERG